MDIKMNDRWRQVRKIFKYDNDANIRYITRNLPDELVEVIRSLVKDITGNKNEQTESDESKSI